MRPDLYTLALISALPEEHVFLSAVDPQTFSVTGNSYSIHPVSTDGPPVFDRVFPVDDENQADLDAVQVAEVCKELRAGAGMVVVQRDLIRAVIQELDPPQPEPPQYQPLFSARDLLEWDQIPTALWDAIYERARSDIQVRKWLDKALAGNVSVQHPEFKDGMALFLSEGLMDQALHDEILQGKRVG